MVTAESKILLIVVQGCRDGITAESKILLFRGVEMVTTESKILFFRVLRW